MSYSEIAGEAEFVCVETECANEILSAGASLLISRVEKHDDMYVATEADIADYHKNVGSTQAHFALVHNELGLVAIARVDRGLSAAIMYVSAIATRPDLDRSGCATTLMRCIAERATKEGRPEMQLVAEAPGFFAKLGFTHTVPGLNFMDAPSAVVADSN